MTVGRWNALAFTVTPGNRTVGLTPAALPVAICHLSFAITRQPSTILH
jgi:hypothetical protein